MLCIAQRRRILFTCTSATRGLEEYLRDLDISTRHATKGTTSVIDLISILEALERVSEGELGWRCVVHDALMHDPGKTILYTQGMRRPTPTPYLPSRLPNSHHPLLYEQIVSPTLRHVSHYRLLVLRLSTDRQ